MSTSHRSDRASTPPRRRPPKKSYAQRAGRMVAILLFYVFVGSFCVVAVSAVASQLFWPEPGGNQPVKCTDGLVDLANAVVRASSAAAGVHAEAEALRLFRQALAPEWDAQADVTQACRGNETNEGALDAIVRLRYAEEHAVRRGAGTLAPLRAQVRSILAPLRTSAPATSALEAP